MRTIILIGTYPPRRCGIATFTAELRNSLVSAASDLSCRVIAMTDEDRYDYPAEVDHLVQQNNLVDYSDAARHINESGPDLLCIQHEFGIFGGPAGRYLLTLLDSVSCRVVSTLHTVLERPDADQKYVFEGLLARSDKVVVMAERGRDVLQEVWRFPANKTEVVPHGTPDRRLEGNSVAKTRLGFAGRDLLLTFGLLSPDKGIETVIEAMPAILAARPLTTYLISGITHPNLLAQEGERYRESLISLSTRLGVGEAVCFVNKYLAQLAFLDTIAAADVCIMPYRNEGQITSGTLAYAAGLGKAIISTPFWHAREVLARGSGILVPFGDQQAVAEATVDLLGNWERRQALQLKVFEGSRTMLWSRLGERYLQIFYDSVQGSHGVRSSRVGVDCRPRANISLKGVRRLTDDCGILQHSRLTVPDRTHGYCLDDNARALLLLHKLPGPVDEERKQLSIIYAAFIEHAWNESLGCFRNFMSYEGKWLEDKGSDDSFGRSVWAAGTAAESHEIGLQHWAKNLLDRVLPHVQRVSWPRSNAFLLIGLSRLADAGFRADVIPGIISEKAAHLAEQFEQRRLTDWPWFEDHLSYDNARLPEALLRAGKALGNDELVEYGLDALLWLGKRQTSPNGHFRPIATADFIRFRDGGSVFDQQPLEAAAMVDACEAAFSIDGNAHWIREAERAYDWYFGANDAGASLVEPEKGECYDGLTRAGMNLNQGAESVLAFQLASCTIQTLCKMRPG